MKMTDLSYKNTHIKNWTQEILEINNRLLSFDMTPTA
jgi:hypothetical protein